MKTIFENNMDMEQLDMFAHKFVPDNKHRIAPGYTHRMNVVKWTFDNTDIKKEYKHGEFPYYLVSKISYDIITDDGEKDILMFSLITSYPYITAHDNDDTLNFDDIIVYGSIFYKYDLLVDLTSDVGSVLNFKRFKHEIVDIMANVINVPEELLEDMVLRLQRELVHFFILPIRHINAALGVMPDDDI